MKLKPRTAGAQNEAQIWAVIGASGMGKGRTIKEELLPPILAENRHVLVWSPLESSDEYAKTIRGKVSRSVGDLVAQIKAGQKRLVFVPQLDDAVIKWQFDGFCRVAWAVEGCAVVVEELSRVTTPTKAPRDWRNLTTQGRHRGMTIIGAAQRPAQVDKDFFSQCTRVRAFRLNFEADVKTMAGVVSVPPVEIRELQKFQYYERDMYGGQTIRGVIKK